ncbi:MAG TPA: hypothetical protein VK654_17615 [Nitrospirota bacterium]|nr:hypothetical protein [Nitrospirota bacterium]
MQTDGHDIDRREFLMKMVSAGVVGSMVSTALVQRVFAMGAAGKLSPGVQKMQGTVMINGVQAQIGTPVAAGDVITTGSASHAVVIVDQDVYLIRENSRIELVRDKGEQASASERVVRSLKVTAGRILSVFGPGAKRIETVSAVAGVRGTGVYVEIMDDITYLCLCYGKADIDPKAYPANRVSLETTHHESPFYILPAGMKRGILRAPVINHTDEEVIMLESLVGRVPPFGKKPLPYGY